MGYQYTLNQNQTSAVVGDEVTYKKDTVKFPFPLKKDENIEITVAGVKYQEVISTDLEQSFKNLSDQVSAATGMSATVDYATGTMTITSTIPAKDFIVNSAKNNNNNAAITTITEAKGSGQKLILAFEDKLRDTITAIDGYFVTSKSEVDIPKPGDQFTSKIQLDLSNPILGISNVSMGELFQEDGKLYIKQLNADYLVGYIAPVKFINNGGLNPVGDNKYFKTSQSGDPKYIEGLSEIKNEILEVSNTSIADSLVDLMVFQKSFEANSKSVTTSDELLKTALQLKAR
jgi:flagellar hook protein FlgE